MPWWLGCGANDNTMSMFIVVVSAVAAAAIESWNTLLLADPSVLAEFIVAMLEVICE
jgi:hypothetical protein